MVAGGSYGDGGPSGALHEDGAVTAAAQFLVGASGGEIRSSSFYGGSRAREEVWVGGLRSGGRCDPGGAFYRARGVPRRRGDMEVVAAVGGGVGATARGDEGVVGCGGVIVGVVRTRAEDAERLGRPLRSLALTAHGGCARRVRAEKKAARKTAPTRRAHLAARRGGGPLAEGEGEARARRDLVVRLRSDGQGELGRWASAREKEVGPERFGPTLFGDFL